MRNWKAARNAPPGWTVTWDIEDRYKLLPESDAKDLQARYTDLKTKHENARLAEDLARIADRTEPAVRDRNGFRFGIGAIAKMSCTRHTPCAKCARPTSGGACGLGRGRAARDRLGGARRCVAARAACAAFDADPGRDCAVGRSDPSRAG